MTTTTAPATAQATCRCGDPISQHIGGKPCVYSARTEANRPRALHDLPIFGRFWSEDARDLRA